MTGGGNYAVVILNACIRCLIGRIAGDKVTHTKGDFAAKLGQIPLVNIKVI